MPNNRLQAVHADYAHGLITNEEWARLVAELTSTAEETSTEPVWRCSHCEEPGEWPDGSIEDCKIEVDGRIYCSEDCAEEAGYHRCAWCEEWGENTWDSVEAADEWFCCADCAEHAGYHCCERCGDWAGDEDEVEAGGYWYCSTDCAHEDGWEVCEYCGEWHLEDESIVADNDSCGCYCSAECARNDGLFFCDHCDAWYRETRCNGQYEVRHYGELQTWCEHCYGDNSFYCEGCDENVSEANYGHDGRCEACCENGALHEYGWTPCLGFFGGDSYQMDTPFEGIELETDSGSDRRGYVEELADLPGFAEHFWMTKDSSLDNGVEITGHPMTLAYHERIMKVYEGIRDTAIQFGYVSHNSGNCGLHIHVNRNFFGRNKFMQDACGYKMMRALQRFEHQFTVFSRRTDGNYWCNYNYCGDYSMPKKNGKVQYSMREFRNKVSDANCDRNHTQALNFQHYSTFEFRIFRGTLKLETLFASMGLVNGLCHVAKKRGSMFFETCDWYTLIGEIVENVDTEYAKDCLVAYLEERGLN